MDLGASCLALFGGVWGAVLGAGAFRLGVGGAFSWSLVGVGCRLLFSTIDIF